MNDDILHIEDDSIENLKKTFIIKNENEIADENIEEFDISKFIVDDEELNDDDVEDDNEELKEERRRKKEARELFEKIKAENGVPEPVIITKEGNIKKASELNITEQIDEFVRCATDPVYLIETYFFIFDQTKGTGGEIVNFKLFDFQKRLINDYQEHRFNVSNKYRQAGISTTTCAFIAWYLMFTRNRTVAIVANKQATATNELMSDVVDFIEGCPDYLKPQPLKNTQILKIYDNGSKVGAFNPKGLRGLTPTLLFWDEVAWTEKSDKFWEGAKPTLQTGGRAIFVSCVTKDSYLFTNNGLRQIKDFIPNEELGAHVIDEYSILGKDKLRNGNLFFCNGFVDTLKIKTMYSELESSLNHKYWAFKNSTREYNWYKASELEVDDWVSIQYGMEIWSNNDDCSDFNPTDTHHIRNSFKPTKITPDIAYLIGLYISEGSVIKRDNRPNQYYGITITCGDSEDIKRTLNKLNIEYSTSDDLHFHLCNLNLAEFLQYLGFNLLKKAPQKIIPNRVLEMGRENIIAMIQGIMDGDGWATSKKTNSNNLRIGIGLSSKELVMQLRMLFSNFGILTEYFEVNTRPTERVKVWSMNYRIVANSEYAEEYFRKIGFRFQRKQDVFVNYKPNKKHVGIYNNIPNGGQILNEIYNQIKCYGKFKTLEKNGIKIKAHVQHDKYLTEPSSRKTILKLIDLERENINKEYFGDISINVSSNLAWTKIKEIAKSKNNTYDFSLPNCANDMHEFGHSVAYNQIVTHNTPNSQDAIFYKTFDGAKNKKGINDFNAVELWWFNDPRYNKDLSWVKYKGKENEIRLTDENFSDEKRIQMMYDKWEATSPWFELQVRNANGDMRKIAQEILCVEYSSIVTVRNKFTGLIEDIKIGDFFNKISRFSSFAINNKYQILGSSNQFLDFEGVKHSKKSKGYKITLEDGTNIIVSEDHIFLVNESNQYCKSLIPNISYLTTDHGDLHVKSIEGVDECDFYDIIDSENCEYIANTILNHNCSFLGSGDNFIDQEFLTRIELHEIMKPIREENGDKNMHIFEDPKPEDTYIMTLDVSSGHGDDNSTINILKYIEYIELKNIIKNGVLKKTKVRKFKFEQVAEYMGKLTPQQLGKLAYQYGIQYNHAYCTVDITGGLGAQTVETLLEMGYENMHYSDVKHKASRNQLDGYIKTSQRQNPDGTFTEIDLIPGFLIGSNRGPVLLELQRSINMADVVIRSDRSLSELKTFVTVKGSRVADHKRTYHDDSIMGIAIALFVTNYEMHKFKLEKTDSKKLIETMARLNSPINSEYSKPERIFKSIPANHPQSQFGWLYRGLNKR